MKGGTIHNPRDIVDEGPIHNDYGSERGIHNAGEIMDDIYNIPRIMDHKQRWWVPSIIPRAIIDDGCIYNVASIIHEGRELSIASNGSSIMKGNGRLTSTLRQ